MPDREKVIKAWEIFRDSNPYEICDGREFRAIKEPEYCMGQMIEDTIAMLKEQENESMDKLRIENAELIQRILQLEKDLAKERAYNYAIVTVIRNNCPPEEGGKWE